MYIIRKYWYMLPIVIFFVSLSLFASNAPAPDISTFGGASTNKANQYNFAQVIKGTSIDDAVTISWDLDKNQIATVTLAGNRTLGAPDNMRDGGTYILIVKQDGSGSRTLSYNSAFKFPAGTAPTLTTAASSVDVLTFISDGSSMYGVSQLDLK
tara:strand:+ start:559 stop:1020 length:462 start_codon:yes stop_codon:yes gene_type:complete